MGTEVALYLIFYIVLTCDCAFTSVMISLVSVTALLTHALMALGTWKIQLAVATYT